MNLGRCELCGHYDCPIADDWSAHYPKIAAAFAKSKPDSLDAYIQAERVRRRHWVGTVRPGKDGTIHIHDESQILVRRYSGSTDLLDAARSEFGPECVVTDNGEVWR